MKKKIVLVVMLVALILVPVTAASTQGAAKTKFGVGLNLGTNEGVAFQYKISNQFDLIANISFGAVYGYIGGDVGVNFKVADFDWTDGDWFLTVGVVGTPGVVIPKGDDGAKFYLGAFAPVRLNYSFPKAPWSFYLTLAPGLQIVPSLGFQMQGNIGAMYLFN
jgi:hypothetical protein